LGLVVFFQFFCPIVVLLPDVLQHLLLRVQFPIAELDSLLELTYLLLESFSLLLLVMQFLRKLNFDCLVPEILLLQFLDLSHQFFLLLLNKLLLLLEFIHGLADLLTMELLDQLLLFFLHVKQPFFVLFALAPQLFDFELDLRLFFALVSLHSGLDLGLDLSDFLLTLLFLLLQSFLVGGSHTVVLLNPLLVFDLPVLFLRGQSVIQPLHFLLMCKMLSYLLVSHIFLQLFDLESHLCR
jgi:hypothetical protein